MHQQPSPSGHTNQDEAFLLAVMFVIVKDEAVFVFENLGRLEKVNTVFFQIRNPFVFVPLECHNTMLRHFTQP
jgi:hypothetical protein